MSARIYAAHEPAAFMPFHPLRGAHNPHLQTLLPRLLRRQPQFTPITQTLETPDGDFLELAWTESPLTAKHKPRVVLFHGLEGNFHSPYAHGLLQAIRDAGWLGLLMHFRGCGSEPNRLARAYHSGDTADARFVLQWLQLNFGEQNTAAIGISLGGNMLARYLAEYGTDSLLQAAVTVSAPFALEPCSRRLEQGFSRIYHQYLLGKMKSNLLRKMTLRRVDLPLSQAEIRQLRRLRDFDHLLTAPLHGFDSAEDYYQRCSALPVLAHITVPTLMLHAKDDPFMTEAVIPPRDSLPANIEYQLTEHGGHVGFVGGTWQQPQMWLEQRIPQWLRPHLE
ncbi:hydrolase [Plesiomonas shigelloides]|uniref:hydrolase n=2 Tax=Plesiomonas shigelloides TaxID=703 RepID=UPI002FCC9827